MHTRPSYAHPTNYPPPTFGGGSNEQVMNHAANPTGSEIFGRDHAVWQALKFELQKAHDTISKLQTALSKQQVIN